MLCFLQASLLRATGPKLHSFLLASSDTFSFCPPQQPRLLRPPNPPHCCYHCYHLSCHCHVSINRAILLHIANAGNMVSAPKNPTRLSTECIVVDSDRCIWRVCPLPSTLSFPFADVPWDSQCFGTGL